MSNSCSHQHLKFIGILNFRDYPEKCFVCEECSTIVSDYITTDEMKAYSQNQSMTLDL